MKTKFILRPFILVVTCAFIASGVANAQSPTPASGKKPNILKLGKHHLDFNARYVHEFGNEHRPQGNLFAFNASFTF